MRGHIQSERAGFKLRCARGVSPCTLLMSVQSRFAHLLTKRVKRHGVACVTLRGGEGEGSERGHRLLSQPASRDWRPTNTSRAFEKTGSTVSRRKVSVSSVGLCALAIAMAARVSAMGPRCEGRGPGNCGSRHSCRAATGQARVRRNARPASIAARRHRKFDCFCLASRCLEMRQIDKGDDCPQGSSTLVEIRVRV